jgi:hypothetical protein
MLENSILEYLSAFPHVRLFTFTLRTTCFEDCDDSTRKISEIWRRFIISLRRSTALLPRQREAQYIKVVEFTKKGFPHLHVFITEYLNWATINQMWNNAIYAVIKNDPFYIQSGHKLQNGIGHVNIKHSFSAARAARYVVKYVLKAVKEKMANLRIWSRSGNVVMFERKKSSGEWHFINLYSSMLNLSILSVSSQSVVYDAILNRCFNEEPQKKIENST